MKKIMLVTTVSLLGCAISSAAINPDGSWDSPLVRRAPPEPAQAVQIYHYDTKPAIKVIRMPASAAPSPDVKSVYNWEAGEMVVFEEHPQAPKTTDGRIAFTGAKEEPDWFSRESQDAQIAAEQQRSLNETAMQLQRIQMTHAATPRRSYSPRSYGSGGSYGPYRSGYRGRQYRDEVFGGDVFLYGDYSVRPDRNSDYYRRKYNNYPWRTVRENHEVRVDLVGRNR